MISENCGETLEYINARNNPLYRRKMENALTDLLDELQSPIENRLLDFPCKDYSKPTLEYYILKLLNMSRECVADLSVSSDNNSTFNTVDFDYAKTCCQNEESDRESLSSYCSRIKSDELKKCEFQKPKILDEPNKNWKKVFGKSSLFLLFDISNITRPFLFSENNKKEDVLVNEDTSSPKSNKITNSEKSPSELSINVIVEENVPSPITSRTHKFDTITEKCSKKISELTDLLTKVRQEKEVLLNSTSRVSGPVLSKRNRNFAESFSKIEEENIGELSSSNENQQEENINSKIITDFTKRYN